MLIDTAGVRRRSRVDEGLEKWSVIKTLQAIDDAHVVIGVVDARETVAEQDATLFGLVAERGRALVIAVNKWDHVAPGQRDEIRDQVAQRLRFLDFAPVHFISALHGSGVGDLMDAVRAALRGARCARCRRRSSRACWRRRSGSTSRRSCAAAGSGCAMRTRAAAIRR